MNSDIQVYLRLIVSVERLIQLQLTSVGSKSLIMPYITRRKETTAGNTN